MSQYEITERTRVKRGNKRATYDEEAIHAIIDEAYICHVGCKLADKPMVQPTCHWREGNKLYIHGSSKNGLFKGILEGEEACISITILDGFVMARSSFHHSVNYRSVCIFSKGTKIEDEKEKLRILNLMMKKITPDRYNDIREPNAQELKATGVICFELNEVSAKVRTGAPVDDEADYAMPVWAGEIPIMQVRGKPVDDPRWLEDHGPK